MTTTILILSVHFLYVGTGLRISSQGVDPNAGFGEGPPVFYEVDDKDNGRDGNDMSSPNWRYLGNYMTKIAYNLFKADQCGHCGEPVAQVGAVCSLLNDIMVTPAQISVVQENTTTCSTKKISGKACENSPEHNYKECHFPYTDETKKLFNKYLFPRLKDQEGLALLREELKDTLVVHLRGTDILDYNFSSFGAYMPAPCKFVHDVIEKENFSKVRLITDDTAHPCLSYIQSKVPGAVWHKGTMLEDFRIMMSAKNFVLSTSSNFGMAALMMYPGKHGVIAQPTFDKSKAMPGGGNFNEDRFNDLCKMGSETTYVYEMSQFGTSHPTRSRREYVVDDANFVDAHTLHKC